MTFKKARTPKRPDGLSSDVLLWQRSTALSENLKDWKGHQRVFAVIEAGPHPVFPFRPTVAKLLAHCRNLFRRRIGNDTKAAFVAYVLHPFRDQRQKRLFYAPTPIVMLEQSRTAG